MSRIFFLEIAIVKRLGQPLVIVSQGTSFMLQPTAFVKKTMLVVAHNYNTITIH